MLVLHPLGLELDKALFGFDSVRSLMLTIFLSKLNNMKVCRADIGNAYLEANTKEKLCIVAGPEFEELQ